MQAIVHGHDMHFRFPYESFTALVNEVRFPEEWPALMHSPLVLLLAHNAFKGNHGEYLGQLQMFLTCCILPWEGITLAMAKVNFDGKAQFESSSPALEPLA